MKTNFIILFIFICLISIILSSNDYSKSLILLKKYKKIVLDKYENVVIFDSDSFSEGDKMFFKITAIELDYDDIIFEFFDDYNSPDITMEYNESPERIKDAKDYMIVMYGLVMEQHIFTQSKKIKNILKQMLKGNILQYILNLKPKN